MKYLSLLITLLIICISVQKTKSENSALKFLNINENRNLSTEEDYYFLRNFYISIGFKEILRNADIDQSSFKEILKSAKDAANKICKFGKKKRFSKFRQAMKEYKTIYEMTLADYGITYNVVEKEIVEGGYIVSTVGNEKTYPENSLTLAKFTLYILRRLDLFSSVLCFGAWLDVDNSLWYLDLSEVYDDLQTAYDIAKSRNQIAIFDLYNFETIYIVYP